MFQINAILRRACAVVVAGFLSSSPAFALLENGDVPRQNGDADFRAGALLPSAAQLSLVSDLGATASWNRFGTVHSLIRHGGYLASGYSGGPEAQARAFVKAHAALFKLSPASVDALELVNEGVTPHNEARAVLLRQRFGDLPAAADGLITVGVVDGKVYYVSSSSAGDQAPPAAATLSPTEAWMLAAADLGRPTAPNAIRQVLDRTDTLGWHLLDVAGFAQQQRSRLVALPIPAGGVRQAYETIVLDVQGASTLAFISFVDAQTGAVLKRDNAVNWQTGAVAAAFVLPSWKYFAAYPQSDGKDTRLSACLVAKTGCDFVTASLSSRLPWDVLAVGAAPTLTTIGNNANTSEAWGSPLTPAEMYRPLSPTRSYAFAFSNVWSTSKCNPTNLRPGGNDIDNSIVQLFASHNRMHDWSYSLGFTERNYNLQSSNFGLTSPVAENDPELGQAQAGAISGTFASPTYFQAPGRNNANQVTLNDGVPGITNQYLFQALPSLGYAPCADANYDFGVVGHEYTHAITNRMIGGPDNNIGGDQGRAMGESWGDLTATEYLMELNLLPVGDAAPTALGAYATGDKERGIRNFSFVTNPLNYSNLGYDTSGIQVHADGEIWSGVNWVVRQALIDKYESSFPYKDTVRQFDCAAGLYAADACPGNRRWVQMQFDSFLLMPASPSMLDARDAMLAADVARFKGANQKEMWRAFASRGMGATAFTNGGSDRTPTPSFESPLETPATLQFVPVAGDQNNTPVVGAKLYVGRFATRTRAIADTDPATVVDSKDAASLRRTSNTLDTARLVPGIYDFIVEAPGFGIHSFRGLTIAPGANTLRVTLPSNWASKTRGATVITSATEAVNIAAASFLIDDTENTGVRLSDTAPVEGKFAIVKLAGGARTLNSANVSTAAGPAPITIELLDDEEPNNAGRFIGVRKFELRTCSGSCAAAADFKTVAFTSPDDAFPGRPFRPTQPDINIRSFSFAPVTATHVMLRVLTNQCTGQKLFQGDTDADQTFSTDCPSFVPPPNAGINTTDLSFILPVRPNSVARASEIQLFGSQASAKVESASSTTAPPVTTIPPVVVGEAVVTPLADGSGRFGGALGLGLLLPLLQGQKRRRPSV